MSLDRTSVEENEAAPTVHRRSVMGWSAAALAAIGLAGALKPSLARAVDATPEAMSDVEWGEFDAMLAAVAPNVSMLAADLSDGTVSPIHSVSPELVQPVGSSFKLWVLYALSKLVEDGTINWEDEVEIQDQYRSVPGGDLRYVQAGTRFTVRYLAERMIQKSDNTATDHVLFLVGRENAEAAMAEVGHHDPSLNTPLFATREFAMLKFAATDEERAAYLAASVEERRRILEEDIAAIPFEALSDLEQTAPIEIDTFEWFANRTDLALTMNALLAQSQKPGLRPVAEILSLETQLEFDGSIWPYVGFKGGSEMGVLSGTWLMQSMDGRYFVYSVGFSDPDAALDMGAAVAAMNTGRDLLGAVAQS